MKLTITEHQNNWEALFNNEKEEINNLIGFLNPVIVHIGSTSVPGLCAKPTIDIQVGLQTAADLDKTIVPMQQRYTYLKIFEPDWPSRRFYCQYKNDTGKPIPAIINVGDPAPVKQGLTSLFNIHVFVKGTDDWIRHIAFRDYLASHTDDRDAYCHLKKELAKNDYDDMMAYNDAKNDFVKDIQQKALEWYGQVHNSSSIAENEPDDIVDIDQTSIEAGQKAAYPNIKFTVILFFIFLLNSLVVVILAGIIFGAQVINIPIMKMMLYMTPVLITINYALRKSKKHQGYTLRINLNKIQWWLFPVIIIGTLALIIPFEQVSAWIPMPQSVQKIFEKTFTKDIFSIITIVIAAPILEEILCRGIVLNGLLKNYSPYKAILISAVFFGALHLNPWQAVPAFLNGLFIGWVYYKTQSAIPGIIIHATINIAVVLFMFLPNHHHQDLLNLLGLPHYLAALLISITIFIIIGVVIHKKAIIIPKQPG